MSKGVGDTFYYDESDQMPLIMDGTALALASAGSPARWKLRAANRMATLSPKFSASVDADAGDEGGDGAGSGGLSTRSRTINDARLASMAKFLEEKDRRSHEIFMADHKGEMQRYTTDLTARLAELVAEEGCGDNMDRSTRHGKQATGRQRLEQQRAAAEQQLALRRKAVALRKADLDAKRPGQTPAGT